MSVGCLISWLSPTCRRRLDDCARLGEILGSLDAYGRRFAGRGSIADLGCGIGGDLLGLAQYAPVWGIDLHRARLRAAQMNAAAAGVGDRVGFVEAEIEDDCENYFCQASKKG